MLAGGRDAAGLGIIFIIIAIILLLRVYLAVRNSEYFISSHRVYVKYGAFSKTSHEIKNEWITSVAVHQGSLGRTLNYGDVAISVPGHLGTVAMLGVSDPLRVKAILDDVLKRFKEAQKIQEELKTLEREYMYGRIPKERYEELKKKYEEELKKLF
jgi:uncharacterized membrane protein YdbT with pleckstrin-like domain